MTDRDAGGTVALIRRGVVFELRLYRSLFRWVTRRPVPRGATGKRSATPGW